MRLVKTLIGMILISIIGHSAIAQIVKDDPDELRNIDVEEKQGESIPLDLSFIDDHGEQVQLSKYFNRDKPVILILGYYSCPMLCNLVMNGVSEAIRQLDWQPGNQYEIVSVSIDPTETDVLAAAKKANYVKELAIPGAGDGWTFLTDKFDNTKTLAEAVGFKYFYVEERKEYAHPAVLITITPEGNISRYLYGIEFKPRDIKLALLEASEGKVGSTIDRIVLYCYHYDPDAGSYTVFAGNVMRLGGGITLVIMGVFLGIYWIRERRKSRREHLPPAINER